MPRITSKPQETVQAQIASFTSEHVKDRHAKYHLMHNIASIALQPLQPITRTVLTEEYHIVPDDNESAFVRLDPGAVLPVAEPRDYVKFLRGVKGSKSEMIHGRAELLAAYEHFAPAVAQLKEQLSDSNAKKEHSNFLGSGSSSSAFSIEVDNIQYAVRIPGKNGDAGASDSHMAGAILGKGIPHLEQIVAASYEEGITVAERMPGKEVGKMTIKDIEGITMAQLADLVETLKRAFNKGIEIDPKPSNFLYDSAQGFGVVDYGSSFEANKSSTDQTLAGQIGWIATVIANMGTYKNPEKPDSEKRTPQDYKHEIPLMEVVLEKLRAYRKVAADTIQADDLEMALKPIDERIRREEDILANYLDDAWVTKRIDDAKATKNRPPISDEEYSGFV